MNLQEQMQQWKELRDEYENLRRKLSPPGKTGIYSEVPSYYFVDPDGIVYPVGIRDASRAFVFPTSEDDGTTIDYATRARPRCGKLNDASVGACSCCARKPS